MEYGMEQLVELTGWLAERYTSKEISSITYETAGMLMEAVIYCIREHENTLTDGETLPSPGELPDVKPIYESGYQAVLDKVKRARGVYGMVIAEFEDYGCRNYSDTITRGIPAFFVRYDPRFCPQNHILTLDYPVLGGNELRKKGRLLCGVDLIYEYLKQIRAEQLFLARFDRQAVVNLLHAVYGRYEELYLDNICYPVLLNALGCLMAGKSVAALEPGRDGICRIENALEGSSREEIEAKLRPLIHVLTGGSPWFMRAAALYTPYMEHAVQCGGLEQLFQV